MKKRAKKTHSIEQLTSAVVTDLQALVDAMIEEGIRSRLVDRGRELKTRLAQQR